MLAFCRRFSFADILDKDNPQIGDGIIELPRKTYRASIVKRQRTGCDDCKKRYDCTACALINILLIWRRNRKKKCDEAQPKCSDCRRLKLPCTRTFAAKTVCNAPSSNPQSDAASPEISVSIEQESVLPPVVMPSPSTSSSLHTGVFDLVSLDQNGSPQSTPIYQWLATENVSALANDSVEFDIINDLNHDNEGPERLVLNPFDESNLSYDNAILQHSNWLFPDSLTIPYSPKLSPLTQLANRQDQHLFQHYIHIVSHSLCIASGNDDNPFLGLMIPLAAASPAVMGGILTLSAIHLKHNGGYPEVVQRGINLQTKGTSRSDLTIGFCLQN